MAARTLIHLPPLSKKGDVIEVRTMIAHAMETGYRPGADGKVLPRDLIRRFVCTYDDGATREVLDSAARKLLDGSVLHWQRRNIAHGSLHGIVHLSTKWQRVGRRLIVDVAVSLVCSGTREPPSHLHVVVDRLV